VRNATRFIFVTNKLFYHLDAQLVAADAAEPPGDYDCPKHHPA